MKKSVNMQGYILYRDECILVLHLIQKTCRGEILMKKLNLKNRKGQKGFTLVELAVVMIIVGLLIGGILKGQELITNAQVASTITQAQGLDAAVSTFRDSYRALPGDMANPGVRLPNCNAAPCNIANAAPDGRIATAPDAVVAAGSEAQRFFVHLAAAELITGVQNQNDVIFGSGLPETSIGGGGYVVGYAPAGGLGNNGTASGGHYLSIREAAAAPSAGNGPLTAAQAARIDAKMDDGSSDTGSVFTFDGTCEAAAGVYDEGGNPDGCYLFVRIQG
tara:strand:- start:4161 stop:4991 length:831 start_codon:yes stop_codon:yes gene_type:complete